MKDKLPMIARYLLGLLFFAAGLAGLIMKPQTPEDFPEKALAFFNGMAASGYFFPFLKITETVCGLLLLVNRAAPLALVVLAPISINIFLFHTFLTPGVKEAIVPILIIVLHITAAKKYSPIYKPLFGKGH